MSREPERRGELLVEAGEHWHRAGETTKAIEMMMEAAELGGEDGGYARVSLAGMFVDMGWTVEADAQLAAMRRERSSSPGPYELAAELEEERGHKQAALGMYDLAVSNLDEEDLVDARDPDMPPTYARMLIGARRRLRRALRLPPDDWDESIPESPAR